MAKVASQATEPFFLILPKHRNTETPGGTAAPRAPFFHTSPRWGQVGRPGGPVLPISDLRRPLLPLVFCLLSGSAAICCLFLPLTPSSAPHPAGDKWAGPAVQPYRFLTSSVRFFLLSSVFPDHRNTGRRSRNCPLISDPFFRTTPRWGQVGRPGGPALPIPAL